MFLTLEDSHNIFVSEEIRLHNSMHRMITILFKKKRDVCRVCVWLSWPATPVCLGPEGFFQDVRIFMLTEMNRMSWSLPRVYVYMCIITYMCVKLLIYHKYIENEMKGWKNNNSSYLWQVKLRVLRRNNQWDIYKICMCVYIYIYLERERETYFFQRK